MQSYWAKAGYPIDLKPQIIGTLYQTGLFKVNGLIRIPRKNSIPNDFGEKVLLSTKLFNYISEYELPNT